MTRRRAGGVVLMAALVSGCSPAPDDSAAPAPRSPSPEAAVQTSRPRPPRPRPTAPPTIAAPRPTSSPAPPQAQAPIGIGDVDRARNPRALAGLLIAAESAVRDPSVRGAALGRAAHVQQRVYRRLTQKPRWREETLRHIPAALQSAARNNMGAGVSLTSLSSPQPKLPDWRIVRPPPARKLLRAYRRAGGRFGIRWQYLAAINLVETRMGRIRGRSTAGAQGPMQFMPATWDAYGRGDVNDPDDAIEAAARYLAAHGAPGDMDNALWNYNHSDKYVSAVSAYARVMIEDPRAFRGYYHWQVYYRMRGGAVLLPVGYGR